MNALGNQQELNDTYIGSDRRQGIYENGKKQISKLRRIEEMRYEDIYSTYFDLKSRTYKIADSDIHSVQVKMGFPSHDDTMITLYELELIFNDIVYCLNGDLKEMGLIGQLWDEKWHRRAVFELTEKGKEVAEQVFNLKPRYGKPPVAIRFKKSFILPLLEQLLVGNVDIGNIRSQERKRIMLRLYYQFMQRI